MLHVSILSGLTTLAVTDRIPAAGSPVPVIPAVLSLGEFRFAQSSPHGGWIRGEYGSITLLPEVFSHIGRHRDPAMWPPPQRLEQILIGWYPDDGSAYWAIPGAFIGWLESWDASGITYQLREADDYGATVTDKHYRGLTLAGVFSAAATTLGLTLNTTWARSPSPAVDWVATGTNRILDNLDTLARFFTHAFFIDSATLYLIDTLADAVAADIFETRGSSATAESLIAAEYFQPEPVRRFIAPFNPRTIRRVRLEILETQVDGTQAGVSGMRVSRSVGGALGVAPISASATNPAYPVSNLGDNNATTAWVSPAASVPGVTLTAVVTGSSIKEYELTAWTATDPMPTRWNLIAYNEWTGVYEYISTVESDDWSATEARRFSVPDPINWQVVREKTYYPSLHLGEEMTISPTGHYEHSIITTALVNIDTDVSRKRCRYAMPIRKILPRQNVGLKDATSVEGRTIMSWIRVDTITYDFVAGQMVVEGGGNWTEGGGYWA